MIYPEFPKTGDTIGICAPSAGIGHKLDSFRKSENAMIGLGYNVIETPSVSNDANPAADAATRGAEFNSLFADDNVKSVYAATGGEFNIEMLPYIDEELVKFHPKWFTGYSDPTNISYYMTTKLDIATIYGTNAGSFDWDELHECHRNALSIMGGDLVTQHSFDLYDSTRDWENINLDTPVSWDAYMPGFDGPVPDKKLDITGRLIGGCIDVINVLIGTPYEDTASFIDRYSDDGFIWYFDNFELDPYYLYLAFTKMKFAGYFRNAKVIVLGRVMYPGEHSDAEYAEFMKKVFPDIPFILGADIGHTKPAMTLINGSIGHLVCKNSEATLDMQLL